jgi:surface antigen
MRYNVRADEDLPKELVISNTSIRSTTDVHSIRLGTAAKAGFFSRLRDRADRPSMRRKVIRICLISGNIVLIAVVLGVVSLNKNRAITPVAATANASDAHTTTAPVDQLASVAVALTVARMANLPEATAVANQADSESIQLAIASSNNTVVNKPQLVSTAFRSNKDIHTYVTQTNDTVSSIATQFGVSSDSIMWSNSLVGNILPAGKTLYIPPTNGIVYTVKSGDTAESLAQKYHATADKITAFNDAEISGLRTGERIVIPDGKIVVTPVYTSYSYAAPSGFAWGSSAIYGYNGYDYGNCTWYVATQIAVPANWGNAATWAAGARAAGWHVSSVPTVGAIAQTPYAAGGFGHVGIVVGINGNQVEIRDMNNYGDGGGFAKVGQGWVPTSSYPNYITAP